MKLTTFVASLVAVVAIGLGVMAVDIQGLPQCSVGHLALLIIMRRLAGPQMLTDTLLQLTCLSAAIEGSGCSLDDTLCQCTTGNKTITEKSVPCISQKCQPPDQTSKCLPS